MRFSLRDLLLTVAFWAGIAWCAAQVGFDNGLFWFSVGASAVVCLLFIYLGRDEDRRHRALIVSMPVLILAFLMGSLALLAEAALLSLGVLFIACRPVPATRTLIGISMAATLIALVCGVIPGLTAVRTLEQIKKAYPIVSLTGRLKYERRHIPPNTTYDPTLSAPMLNRLATFETDFVESYYTNQFKHLHDHQYELFVRAAGFGVGRMAVMLPRPIERPQLKDIPFDQRAGKASPENNWPSYSRPLPSNDLDYLHASGSFDFLNPRYWGALVQLPMGFVGFAEHGFHSPPTWHLKDPSSWSIQRLELVSLLRFDEPRVYALDHLPRMDQLSGDNVPTRPLNMFESKALTSLYGGEDVVVENEGREYQMLGSLRAAKQCLGCHSVQRGDLLGAFSYSLRKNVADRGR
jgi:hypothetical protein